MDPVVDTGFDEGVNDDLINPVEPTTKERELFGNSAPPPELYPKGATGQLEGAAPIPGSTDVDQLPVPPPSFQMAQQEERQGNEMDQDDDEEDVQGDDLFGDDDDASDNDQDLGEPKLPTPPPLDSITDGKPPRDDMEEDDGMTAGERAERRRLEYGEDDEVEGESGDDEMGQKTITEEERIAQVPLANFAVPAGGKVWHAKLPNFLALQSSAWDRYGWQPEEEEDAAAVAAASQQESSQGGEDVKPNVGGGRKGHLPDENVIRWRWTKDELGQVIKQSNARIVRWSDGSLSLQLGAELFDIALALDHSAIVSRAAQPVAPSTAPIGLTPSTFDVDRGHGLTYLTARHDYNRLLEAQASLEGTMTFRPSTLTSQTHRRLAGSVQARYNTKGRGIKTMMLDADPEKRKQEREKQEIEKQRKMKKEAQKAAGKGSRGSRKGKKATTLEGLDLSDEDDDGEGGYAERRSQPRRGRGGPLNRNYSDEEEDEDGFVAKSDDDMQVSDEDPEEIEEAEEAIEREQRRRKDRRKEREYSDESGKEDGGGQGAVRRRMVVDESDEE